MHVLRNISCPLVRHMRFWPGVLSHTSEHTVRATAGSLLLRHCECVSHHAQLKAAGLLAGVLQQYACIGCGAMLNAQLACTKTQQALCSADCPPWLGCCGLLNCHALWRIVGSGGGSSSKRCAPCSMAAHWRRWCSPCRTDAGSGALSHVRAALRTATALPAVVHHQRAQAQQLLCVNCGAGQLQCCLSTGLQSPVLPVRMHLSSA
jgi:hypothetical protein